MANPDKKTVEARVKMFTDMMKRCYPETRKENK